MVSRAEQRRLVWSGKLRKTTGGLNRDDLMLNKSGRIVSKRKSQAASKVNNLGTWLRVRGQGFKEVPSNAKKGSNGKDVKAQIKKEPKKVAKVAPKKQQPKVAPKKVAKVAPKKVAPKKVAKVVPKKVAPKKVARAKVAKAVKKIELKAQKRKLGSKKTTVAQILKKKAEAKARANTKAGAPLSKSKAPEVVAKKAAAKEEPKIDWDNPFGF
jgi:hypothetical protein